MAINKILCTAYRPKIIRVEGGMSFQKEWHDNKIGIKIVISFACISWRINANFFADPMDLNLIVKIIKMIIELNKTKIFQRFGSMLSRDPLVGCGHMEFDLDLYWTCCVLTMIMQMNH